VVGSGLLLEGVDAVYELRSRTEQAGYGILPVEPTPEVTLGE
jgi:hypothetical protein